MSTPLRRYYRGHSLVTMRNVGATQSRVYHFDHQGTTQALTDIGGAVTDRFSCDAWGVEVKRTGTSINRQWVHWKPGLHELRGPAKEANLSVQHVANVIALVENGSGSDVIDAFARIAQQLPVFDRVRIETDMG